MAVLPVYSLASPTDWYPNLAASSEVTISLCGGQYVANSRTHSQTALPPIHNESTHTIS